MRAQRAVTPAAGSDLSRKGQGKKRFPKGKKPQVSFPLGYRSNGINSVPALETVSPASQTGPSSLFGSGYAGLGSGFHHRKADNAGA